MTDEERAKLEREIQAARGIQAAYNVGMAKFFENKLTQLWGAFAKAPAGDIKALETIHHATKATLALQGEMQSVLDTGKLAEAQLANIDTNPE